MFDIILVSQLFEPKTQTSEYNKEKLGHLLESNRSSKPFVFQIETTNVCNLKCVMCPRTSLMKRKKGYMDDALFATIVQQLEPHSSENWKKWSAFYENKAMPLTKAYKEDLFYYQICSDTLILHGFGEPVLDSKLPDRIKLAKEQGLKTYFSMNPINIRKKWILPILESGVSYLKLSLEGMNNEVQKKYRGVVDDDFQETLDKIEWLIEIIETQYPDTQLVLTKLRFNNDQEQENIFLNYFDRPRLFTYIKNQHNRWLYEEEDQDDNTAEYMQRFCEFPWTSLSILYDGTVVPCPLDYDGTISMGNVNKQTLTEIWNGKKYQQFRQMHIQGNFPEGHFCTNRCDFKTLSEIYE